MNYDNKINQATWLNESQKQRLLAIHEGIPNKDIVEQAFDMLSLTGSPTNRPATEYKNMIVTILSKLSTMKLHGYDLEDFPELLNNLYLFFDALDSPSFDTMCEIEEAYNYSDDKGGYEGTIDKLYYERVAKAQNELLTLQNI